MPPISRSATAAILGLTVLTGAYVTGDALDLVPGWVTSDWSRNASSAPQSQVRAAAEPVAQLDPQAAQPDPSALATHMRPVLAAQALGPDVSAMVVDASTGKPLLTKGADRPQTGASTVKLLTAAAVAARSDLSQRRTTAVAYEPDRNTVTLIADGDTLLARGKGNPYATIGHAGLDDLAAATAKHLRAHRHAQERPITIALDDHVAAGPALAPGWEAPDIAAGLTGPVGMIGLADERPIPGRAAPSDPAMSTAKAFREALAHHDIPVAPTLRRAPRGGESGDQIASVQSATLAQMLTVALNESDNALTEAIARRAFADHGVNGTFAAAGAHVTQVLTDAGVDTAGVKLVDTSGLSRGSTITATALTQALLLAIPGEGAAVHPGFTDIVAELPVAALSGTLDDRFAHTSAAAGRGVVRAKTGTLTGVSALAGTLVDDSGRLLLFALIADQASPNLERARTALDAAASALVTCGCSVDVTG